MCKRNLKKLALNLSLPRNGNVAPNPTISMPHSYNSTKDTGMQESTSNVYQHGPACILPNLYLGACYNALNVTQLTHHGITCIINVASEIRIIAPLPHIDYHHIKWTHSQHNLAISEFDRAVDTIRSAHKHHRIVLIHCQQGIERSAALILAFLLKSTRCMKRIDTTIMMDSGIFAGQNWSLDRALEFVKDKAPNIRPNMELLYQLREYEQSIPTQQQQLVEKRHNIQTRARGSATVQFSLLGFWSCIKENVSHLQVTITGQSVRVHNRKDNSSKDYARPKHLCFQFPKPV
ncbi:protein-tyrosine phosphatase-like protein [Parasitella parasitica]|nr:protein-tyrosine phosphatase-like protein [Parasitella parasitica]